ncbi:hypothetical protein EON80_07405, partial [bacterium]
MINRSQRFALLAFVPASFLALNAYSLPAAPQLVHNNSLQVAPVSDPLLRGWNAPPESTKPFVYWYWLNNIITKEGITRDLEMMAKNGIGGGFIADIGGNDLDPPRNGRFEGYSDAGYEYKRHAVREGLRLGVDVGVFNGSGWSQSGGPWVKPQDTMQSIECAEVRVAGGARYDAVLPRIPNALADVRTIAFPAPPQDGEVLR